MTLYEIDEAIRELIEGAVDPETGELLIDDSVLDALQMERDKKVENLALYIKNLSSDINELRQEEKNLAARRRAAEQKAERLKRYLSDALNGEKFSTSKVACTFRNTTAIEVAPGFAEWAWDNKRLNLLRTKPPEPDKAAIKQAISDGEVIPFAEIVTRQSLSIK